VKLKNFEENSVFKLDTSIKDVKDLTSRLVSGFTQEKAGAGLRTYTVQATPATPVGTGDTVTKTKRTLTFSTGNKANSETKMNASALLEDLVKASALTDKPIVAAQIGIFPVGAEGWTPDSEVGYKEWEVTLPGDVAASDALVEKLSQELNSKPVWQTVNRIESRVAEEMQRDAILALIVSMVFIVAYIWFRFQKVAYGLAAVIALAHDVLITLGFIAISHWLFRPLGFLMIEDFKVSLTIVAALLTVMGYSLNDTIVVFDRIREVKGKSPRLTSEMVNVSVNQTLGRTLLTSTTTIFAIILLYSIGGEGVHGFAFTMLIGILVGTYSSIFVAAPILLWFTSREQSNSRIKAA
jgi:SecD/SecF fusion protein